MKSITDILSSAFKEVYELHGAALESVKFDVVETTVRGSLKQSYMLVDVEFEKIEDKALSGIDPNA